MDGDTFSRQNESNNSRKIEQLEFSGSGTEYFKIWIVNILLTMLTLGIYNAWAKVRTKNYFYRNTHLAGSSFRYLASPWSILKGQLIAFGVVILWVLGVQLHMLPPVATIALVIVVVVLIPWIVVRSLMFNAYNSAYRNIRFGFKPVYGESYTALYGWYLLTALTLGLLFPVMQQRIHKLIFNNHTYGKQEFRFNATLGPYYKVYLIALGGILAVGFVFYMIVNTILVPSSQSSSQAEVLIVLSMVYLALLIPILFIGIYVQVSLANIVFNGTNVGDHGFNSRLDVLPMAKLIIVNTILTLLTLGIYYPWAKVKMTRYVLSRLSIEVEGDLNSIIADEERNISSAGEGLAEAFDVGIGI